MGHYNWNWKENCTFLWIGDCLSFTDPGMVEFFKLFLTVLEVLNERVLNKRIHKTASKQICVSKCNLCYTFMHLFFEAIQQYELLHGWMHCLVLQSSHAFLQMKLQSFVGLSEQTIHGVWQTLVVLLIHFLSLTSLVSGERSRHVGRTSSNVLFWQRLHLNVFLQLSSICVD